MGHGHDHSAGDAAVSIRARRVVTAVAVVLGVLTLVGVAVLWPSHDPHGHVKNLHAIGDVYGATTISVHRGTCGTAGGDTSQRCTRIRFRLDEGPDAGQFRTIEFAQTGQRAERRLGRQGGVEPYRRRGPRVRLHVQRPATPIGAGVVGGPLRGRRDRARSLARRCRARRARCEYCGDLGVHLAVHARRQQRATRSHCRRERGRVRRAVHLQRTSAAHDGRVARDTLRARADRRAGHRVHRSGTLHRCAERGRAARVDRHIERQPQEPRPRRHGPRCARCPQRHHRDPSVRGR